MIAIKYPDFCDSMITLFIAYKHESFCEAAKMLMYTIKDTMRSRETGKLKVSVVEIEEYNYQQ